MEIPDWLAVKRIDSVARSKARARLAKLFPDEYKMLVNEERAKAGLPPVANRPGRRSATG